MAYRKILLVEGQDDMLVLKRIRCKHGIPDLDEVRPCGGVSELLTNVTDQIRTSGGEGDIVGVVIDADTDLAARWQSIRDRLTRAEYQDVPAQPAPNGTVLEPPEESPLPRVGVWIMPDNRNPGILEDFLRFLVPWQDALFPHATNIVESLPVQRFSDNDRPKAVMHTWLAWQNSPGRPYGTAIAAGFLNASASQANDLASWLNRLFFPGGPTP